MRKPDFEQLLAVLKNEAPSRPTLFEFYMNDGINSRLTGRTLEKADSLSKGKWIANAYQNAGYDYATLKISDLIYFPQSQRESGESVSLNEGAMIQDWESFDAYQ